VLVNKSFDVACWGLNVAEEAPEVALQQALLTTATGMNYISPDIEAQVKILRESKTDGERKAALEKIQDIWRVDVPAAVYEATPEMIAWQKKVHGLEMTLGAVVFFDKAWIS
jgi:hypothetical protein